MTTLPPPLVGTTNPLVVRFIAWLAQTKRISAAEAWARYRRSAAAFPGGHAGPEYRAFCDATHRVFEPFFADAEPELEAAYQFHARLHFLRMLSYAPPAPDRVEELADACVSGPRVAILDYGCGLAQLSKALATRLVEAGLTVELTLCDLPTVREEFLRWDARHSPYATRFIRCATGRLPARLPRAHLVIASEFFEHVYDPLAYLRCFDARLMPGGLLVTNLHPHQAEFMHVTPQLDALHEYLIGRGYEELVPRFRYRKPW